MVKRQTKRISVIVPVYKVEPYLRQCVDSILAQTYQNLEVILVDDGSPDDCGKICEEYAEKDPRIVVIHKANGGLSSARNVGIERATGDYIAFVDSDDFVAPTMLEKLYKRMQETNAELVLCNVQYIDENGKPTVSQEMKTGTSLPETRWSQNKFWDDKQKRGTCVHIIACSKLYRKQIFEKLRYPVGKIHEDEFVLHQIIDQCQSIATVSERLYYYRQRENSITADCLNPKRLDCVEACLERFEYFRNKKNKKMLQATAFKAIDFLEWFAYESELAGKPLPDRYGQLKQQVIEFTCCPVPIFSPVYWGVVLTYRWGIFPYKLLRNIYWGWVRLRKNGGG